MILQKCRRHPHVTPFMADCYACKQELFDIQERNRRHSDRTKALLLATCNPARAARTGMDAYGASTDARIMSAEISGHAVIAVVHWPNANTWQPTYTVESFRQPTEDEMEPGSETEWKPSHWTLLESYACDEQGQIESALVKVRAYAAEQGYAEPATA